MEDGKAQRKLASEAASILGRRGGYARKKQIGKEGFAEMGRKSGEARKKKVELRKEKTT